MNVDAAVTPGAGPWEDSPRCPNSGGAPDGIFGRGGRAQDWRLPSSVEGPVTALLLRDGSAALVVRHGSVGPLRASFRAGTVQPLGRTGRGPGDFIRARQATRVAPDSIAVWDPEAPDEDAGGDVTFVAQRGGPRALTPARSSFWRRVGGSADSYYLESAVHHAWVFGSTPEIPPGGDQE